MEIEIEDLHIQMEDVVKNKLSVSPDSDAVLQRLLSFLQNKSVEENVRFVWN